MNIPNILTLVRILLIPVFIHFLVKEQYAAALYVFAFGSLTDALDGYIARRFKQITELGGILDPVADKLFLLSSFTASYLIGILPLWFFLIALLKELILLSGYAVLRAKIQHVAIAPTITGKGATAAQMVTILFLLLNGFGAGNHMALNLLFAVTSALIIISTIGYVATGIKMYREAF